MKLSNSLTATAEERRRIRVAAAIGRIKPLPGQGPNRFTVTVHRWGLSAPTKRKLCLMLWHWFAPDPDDEATSASGIPLTRRRT